jgi:hypothetical protein
MANTFNSVAIGVIFQEIRVANGDIIQFIPFVCAFYAFQSPLFYGHRNCECDATIIPSTKGAPKGDPLGGIICFSPF